MLLVSVLELWPMPVEVSFYCNQEELGWALDDIFLVHQNRKWEESQTKLKLYFSVRSNEQHIFQYLPVVNVFLKDYGT